MIVVAMRTALGGRVRKDNLTGDPLHAEQEARAQEGDDEDEEEEEEEEEIEGQAQEGVGGRSSIVLRADGRVRRCTAGRAASRFLPEEIAAQPQWQSKKRPRDGNEWHL